MSKHPRQVNLQAAWHAVQMSATNDSSQNFERVSIDNIWPGDVILDARGQIARVESIESHIVELDACYGGPVSHARVKFRCRLDYWGRGIPGGEHESYRWDRTLWRAVPR